MSALPLGDTLRMAGGRADAVNNTDKGSGTLALEHLRQLAQNIGVQDPFDKNTAIEYMSELTSKHNARPRDSNRPNLIARSLNWLVENGFLECHKSLYSFTQSGIEHCEEYEDPAMSDQAGPEVTDTPWLNDD